MRLWGWLFLLSLLLIGGLGAYLYLALPFLGLPTPWGVFPFYYLLPLAYALGLLVGLLYALALGYGAYRARKALLREAQGLRRELEALRRAHPEEIPRIPDREDVG